MGLVSNADFRMSTFDNITPTYLSLITCQGSVLDDLGVSQFLQAMSFSDEVGVEKPDAAIFLRTLELMTYDGPRSNVVHVGDSYDQYVDTLN
jgi:hypothetical protein